MELSDDDDDDADIVMEMTLSPESHGNVDAHSGDPIEAVVSPIRRDSFSNSESPGTHPTASSPRSVDGGVVGYNPRAKEVKRVSKAVAHLR